ncbi:hypothetical protein BHU72_10290 [Desulfuribacillus stibiiarsenatis]|uniref:Exopolyphosphatase n=1 Tax=Desulfuribacillus stibiiarsenatis TaxID=1390249 RepID=A0A1E5L9D2_9FIRM|nr:Ppx/GppA phosphatase family protein [Desulfuribacillus stibiiarsenatis]OEH86634.1 hypothetical protein BHU72_10290 [Desulfuribacillus stibiiarsenatis]
MKEKNVAIIDMGSNSVRLVIYYINDRGAVYKLDDLKNSIRLSSHFDVDGSINEIGRKLTIQSLKQFKQLCDSREVTSIRGVATAALRQAKNQKEILQEIHKETGITFEILSGQEEARYGYLAVRSSMDIDEAIIVDIGGGSTEISYMKSRKLINSISLPYGAVNMTEKYFKGFDVVSRQDVAPLLLEVFSQLERIPWLKNLKCPVIGLGGTARSLASIHQAKRRYSFNSIHNYKMDAYDIELIFHYLRRTPLQARKNIEGLSSGREDIIVAGVSIYKAIMEYVDIEEFYVSTQGIRDGICHEIVMKEADVSLDEDIVSMHMKRFAHYYKINVDHAEHVMQISVMLFRQLAEKGAIKYSEKEARLLAIAAYLHDIGRSINVYHTHNHTFYLLSNVNLPGLTHKERLLVALVASFKKPHILRERIQQFNDIVNEDDEFMIRQLGFILLIARALDRTASKQVEEIQVLQEETGLVIVCHVNRKRIIETDLAAELVKKSKKFFGMEISLRPIKKLKKLLR